MLNLHVVGMTCEHCVHAVTRAVRSVPGAGEVTVDLVSGAVSVQGAPDVAAVRAAIEDEGYEVATPA
jgi:copper chaperone